ncbi:MAG: porin family protein [Chitinophagales bacterium]
MKIRYFSCLLVLCLYVASGGYAQAIYLGVKGGISIPNLSSGNGNPINSGYSSGLGPDFAIFGDYGFTDRFSVELSLEYSYQGGKKNGKQALPVPSWLAAQYPPGQAPAYLYANFNASAEFDYLLIPLLGKFTVDLNDEGSWKFYGAAGPFVGFLLSAKSITSGSSNVYADAAETMPLLSGPLSFDTTADIKDDLNSTNFGIEVNVGLAYQTGPHRFFLEGGGNYGFIPVQKDKANGENNAGAAVIRLGYAFQIGSKGRRY